MHLNQYFLQRVTANKEAHGFIYDFHPKGIWKQCTLEVALAANASNSLGY